MRIIPIYELIHTSESIIFKNNDFLNLYAFAKEIN